ncbi:hypothetical protein Tco_0846588 [Tanacetum coccineum]
MGGGDITDRPGGCDQRVTELDTTVRQRTEEFKVRFEEAHDDRAYLNARVNSLYRDRPYHRHTALWPGIEMRYMHAKTYSVDYNTWRIATLEARDPEPQDGPTETGSSSIIYGRVKYYGEPPANTALGVAAALQNAMQAGAEMAIILSMIPGIAKISKAYSTRMHLH